MRIVVTGAGGRLGGVVTAELTAAGHHVTALDRTDLDITSPDGVTHAIGRLGPDAIVNCSAYNDVDGAEANQAAAFAINARGPALLADVAAATGALLVHYSTDFVFDGTAREPYDEDAATNPVNVYGASKLAGEEAVRGRCRHFILRVESLFGGTGVRGHQSTIDWIAGKLLSGATVRAVVDRTVSPSYVFDVASATRALLEHDAPLGTYHCVNSGFTSWYELAAEVVRGMGLSGRIEPVRSADLKTVAPRPQFCALSNAKLQSAGAAMPGWQDAVQRHLATVARAQAGAA
jgi:dTDP-4-dehydrorhamnose reductase